MPRPFESYTTTAEFEAWIPKKHIGVLTNDTSGDFSADTDKVKDGLDFGAEMLESKLSIRDDIPIPAVDNDGNTPSTVKKFIWVLCLFHLYERRGHISDQVQNSFDVQMTWISEVATRKANIKLLDANDDEITETNETPIIDGDQERSFDDFSFG